MNPLLVALLMALARKQQQGRRPGVQAAPGAAGAPRLQRGMRPNAAANRQTTMTNARIRQHGPGGELDPGGPGSNSAYTPDTWRAMNYVENRYWQPGITGNDTSPGGGDVFAGFNRGTGWDPNGNRYTNSQNNPVNVGNNTNMGGGDPGNRPVSSDMSQFNWTYSGGGGFGGGGSGSGGHIGPYDT